jgi:threonine dehydratase
MGGQGTLADEVVMAGHGPFDVAYLQIGGGGMASAVSTWLKSYFPKIRIVGVQGVGQASMVEAFKQGKPAELSHVDVFCDGTAVRKTGELTYALCRELLDELITVTNEEVCAAIQHMWEATRCIPEPSGAMGLAGLMKQQDAIKGQRALTVLSGSNLDFGQLAWISAHAGIGGGRRRYMRFEIPERPGGMLDLLDNALDGVNIIEFQYGKTHDTKAWPVIGFEASPLELDLLTQKVRDLGVRCEDVTSEADVEFRIIHYEPQLFRNPFFITFDFPERPGALHDFLDMLRGRASICYFNYTFTGELVGRALLGFEFDTEDARAAFKQLLAQSGHHWSEIPQSVLERVL